MCYWRRVRNIYIKCGHAVTVPDEEIHCELATCKFSAVHPKDCKPPRCNQTCWQYHQYPQQYSPHVDKYCPTCVAARQQTRGLQE